MRKALHTCSCIEWVWGVFMIGKMLEPTASAYIIGGPEAPNLRGNALFYQKENYVLVEVHVSGLPQSSKSSFYGLHIHEGSSCGGVGFSETGSHYNPSGMQHPLHAGDLPPLLRCKDGAYLAVRTDRFRAENVIGKTVVIHGGPDDFTSQPAGNAGEKIACGVIERR